MPTDQGGETDIRIQIGCATTVKQLVDRDAEIRDAEDVDGVENGVNHSQPTTGSVLERRKLPQLLRACRTVAEKGFNACWNY